MGDVVGVCFKPTGKVYYFSATGLHLRPGDLVIAETTKGQELAEVVCHSVGGGKRAGRTDLKPILRQATTEDIERSRESKRRADEARRVCQRLVTQLEMAVKLVDVEYAFDGSRISFSFASEDRTDFRQLQRELSRIYDCEVEIRQIGVRDQAKILGGIGPCGRQLCCASFLRSFEPVTIRMAKDQDLSLNPTKISGLCGRLMCCLRYEQETYRRAHERLPRVGATVKTRFGAAEVTAVDVLRERLTVSGPAGTFQLPSAEVEAVPQPDRAAGRQKPPLAETPAGEDGSPEAKPSAKRETTRRPPKAREAGAGSADQPSEAGERKSRRRGRRSRRGRRRRSGDTPRSEGTSG